LGRLNESVNNLLEVLSFNESGSSRIIDNCIVPHTYYELGLVYIKGRDWNNSEFYLNKAKKYKNFDFRTSLFFKINSNLQFVKKQQNIELTGREQT
jgi:hypothetical protein